MSVTTPKLSVDGRTVWAAYRGLSLLYDHPGGDRLGGMTTLRRLSSGSGAPNALYRRLEGLVEGFEHAARGQGVGWYPLPAYSYHVTLCDGVNDGNRSQVHPERRGEVDTTLRALPDSLHWSNDVVRLLRDPEARWAVWRAPVTFSLAGLGIWGHVLVARLAPVDAASDTALASHHAARDELVSRLRSRLGVRIPSWRPHLTLGYFVNEDAAARAKDVLLPGWRREARAATRSQTVTYRSACLYGFTDMASFWRLCP
ncbi:MAG: hypothetical protein ACLFRD_07550 [Nitriliruptoraceae bacterium]